MNTMMNPGATMTMTSHEIAELTGKRHDNVMRDIRTMLEALKKDVISFEGIYLDAYGREKPCFKLDRELTLTLVSGYDIALRHRVVTRLAALEEQARNPIAALSRVDLLKLALESEEQRTALEHKVEALEPKAAALNRIAMLGNGSWCIREASKILNVQEKRLRQKLQELQWIYHPPVGGNWLGYALAREKGYVAHKRTEGEKTDGTRWESVQVRVTDKGLAKLAVSLQAEAAAA